MVQTVYYNCFLLIPDRDTPLNISEEDCLILRSIYCAKLGAEVQVLK